MNLKSLLNAFSDRLCTRVYVKRLSPNDNSKNQVYFGGSFDILNILPIKEIVTEDVGEWKRTRLKTKIDFYWLSSTGGVEPAPESQLILYPKYPEVRFSGFLKNSKGAPSDLMASRIDRRLLFLGVSASGQVFGHVVSPDSTISAEFSNLKVNNFVGVFSELILKAGEVEVDTKSVLIQELKRIHLQGWIDSKRLDSSSNILPCMSSNCGGYTLEAELGIRPNGYSEPDFLGWEVKQFSATAFNKFKSSTITLMTPEPTNGYYVDSGVEAFVRKFGYIDKLGREARLNFGGIHKFGVESSTTYLKLVIEGFDSESETITNMDGYIGLLDKKDNIASSWSFRSLLKHWITKHNKACYIPSLSKKSSVEDRSVLQYHFGNNIILGVSTDFSLLLKQIVLGNVYYDPGIKLELAIPGRRKQTIKRRSQFRIRSANVPSLYRASEEIDLLEHLD